MTRKVSDSAASPYDDAFYRAQIESSFHSAVIYLDHLSTYFQPSSLADFGCGRGSWLKAAHESGIENLYGIDGPWNSQDKMVSQAIKFIAADLNEPISLEQRVDLAMSLEVAEHLVPASAETFVRSLTDAADIMMFGAAYSHQGGVNHFNEQPHSYWAAIFQSFDYAAFDLFRPHFWGDERVAGPYRQNTFLYVKRGSAAFHRIINCVESPIANTDFMNAVHPYLYEQKRVPPIRESLKIPFRSAKRILINWRKRFLG